MLTSGRLTRVLGLICYERVILGSNRSVIISKLTTKIITKIGRVGQTSFDN